MTRTIVITGAGSGLGLAIARRLGREGHAIVLLGRRLGKVEEAAAAIGNGAFALACDVADPGSVGAAFAAIGERAGRIDVLINNAGVYEPHFIAELTDAQVAAMLDTNLAGPVLCTRAALPLMGSGGHVVNIGSKTAACRAAMLALYQTSKAGLERFTKSLRDEVAERGIRVTLVRAAGMMGEGMEWNVPSELARRFAEERHRLGIDRGENAVSQFASVAELFPWLVTLPDDVDVSELILEARHG
jgi:NAD(P)-dependent dehydrogenase (short-subunit alcohol dehydrogenase family)